MGVIWLSPPNTVVFAEPTGSIIGTLWSLVVVVTNITILQGQ